MHRHRRTLLVLAVSLLFLVGVLIGVRRPLSSVNQPQTFTQFTSEAGEISFEYPANFSPTTLIDEQTKIGMLFRAERPGGEALISLRHEEGLGVLRLTSSSVLDSLIANVDRQYPERFPGFQRESFAKEIVATYPGAVWEFTYTGIDATTRIRQRFLLAVVADNTAYYLSLQAPDTSFDEHRVEFIYIESSLQLTP